MNSCTIFHYALKFDGKLVHRFLVATLFLSCWVECCLFRRHFSRRHVPRCRPFDWSSILNRLENFLIVKTICDFINLFAIATSDTEDLIRLILRHHLRHIKTCYIFRVFTKVLICILLILARAGLNFLWFYPKTLWWWFYQTTRYSFLCNVFRPIMIISSWTYYSIFINLPEWVSTSNSKCSKCRLSIKSQIVLILTRIWRTFPRLVIKTNWISYKSWSWFCYSFSWISSGWSSLMLILVANSKRFGTWRKSFINVILSWIWCHLILFPLISLSFNFFGRRLRSRNACNISHFRSNRIKASACVISSRTWTSFRRLRILYRGRKINLALVFLSKSWILLYIFSKSRLVSKVLSRCLHRSLSYSFLFSILVKC